MNTQSPVATAICKALLSCTKTNTAIAKEIGVKQNVISMYKHGVTNVPISRAPSLAIAIGIDAAMFTALCMKTYHSETWETLRAVGMIDNVIE